MNGLRFDFEANDIVLSPSGSFAVSQIDSQNCALISLSQITRLTKPEIGAQLASQLQNRKQRSVASVLAEAKRMVEADGAKNVSITIDENDNLKFEATYED